MRDVLVALGVNTRYDTWSTLIPRGEQMERYQTKAHSRQLLPVKSDAA